MDYEREFKRLRRLVLRCFLGALILLIAAVFWGSYQLKYLKRQIAVKDAGVVKETIVEKARPVYGVNGINGRDGQDGANGQSVVGSPGANGKDGSNGQNVTADQIASAVASYLKANPPLDGATGPQGPPGRTVLIRINSLTGLTECQYLGDITWQPISECAK